MGPVTPLATWWRCGDKSSPPHLSSTNSASSVVMADVQQNEQPVNDESKPTSTASTPPRLIPSLRGIRSLMQGLVSPIVNCVMPPLSMCTTACESQQQYDYRSSRHHHGEYFVYMPTPSASDSDLLHSSSQTNLHLKSPTASPTASFSSSLPLTNIETCHVHCNDVLCGRSSSNSTTTTHVGNRTFRELIAANRDAYAALSKKQKQALARSIVDLVHATRPQGRFLMRDSMTGLWNDIGMARSMEKTAQALREVKVMRSSVHEVGSSSPSAEDRSVALTAASESLASASTTPASNNSHQKRMASSVIVPPHLKHVYRTNPRAIPSHVDPRKQTGDGRSDASDMHLASPSNMGSPMPMSPESPYPSMRGSLSFPSPTTTYTPQGPAPSPSSEALSPTSTTAPSRPPDIWRIHKNAGSSPDVFRTTASPSSPASPGRNSDCDSLKQLQKGHTLITPSIERISTAEWNGMATIGPRNSSNSVQGLLSESDTTSSNAQQNHIPSALSLEERVVGRKRSDNAVGSLSSSRRPLPPSGVSLHRHRTYEVTL